MRRASVHSCTSRTRVTPRVASARTVLIDWSHWRARPVRRVVSTGRRLPAAEAAALSRFSLMRVPAIRCVPLRASTQAKPAAARTSSKAHLLAPLRSGRFVSIRLERLTNKKDFAIFVLLVVLCAIVTALNPRFLSPANLQNTARLIGAFGIFSLGLGFVII